MERPASTRFFFPSKELTEDNPSPELAEEAKQIQSENPAP
jgi:hypothetical protein